MSTKHCHVGVSRAGNKYGRIYCSDSPPATTYSLTRISQCSKIAFHHTLSDTVLGNANAATDCIKFGENAGHIVRFANADPPF